MSNDVLSFPSPIVDPSPRDEVSPRDHVVLPPETFASEMRLLPGIHLPLRSMLVHTRQGRVLISPVGTEEEARAVGNGLAAVVAPSLLHHLHLVEAVHRYQPTHLWGPQGLDAKVPELSRMSVLGHDPWPYRGELDMLVVEGAPVRREVVFLDRASRTLYAADLWFNVRQPRGVLTPLAFRMMGMWKRFAMSTMWKRWVTDRAAFARSIEAMLRWDFTRIVVAHGDIVERDAHALAERSLRDLGLLDPTAS